MIGRISQGWYALDARERLLIGRFALLLVVFGATHSAFGAMCLWAILDYLLIE